MTWFKWYCNIILSLDSKTVCTLRCHLRKKKDTTFSKIFFPSAVIEWNKLDSRLPKAKSFINFKKTILNFIRPKANGVFNCNSSKGLKFVTRLPLWLGHLREHRFKQSFHDFINLLCSCSLDVELTIHDFLHCSLLAFE